MGNETLIVWFTGVVAVSTVFYVILTGWLAIETRKTRVASVEPRVSIRVELDRSGYHRYELIISNEGQGVAKNVRFEFEGDPTYFRDSFVSRGPPTVDELPIIKNGLDFLEKDQIFRFPIGTVTNEEYERASKSPWIFNLKYRNLYGKRRKVTHTIDFSLLRGTIFVPNKLKEIADHLESISKDISKLTQG